LFFSFGKTDPVLFPNCSRIKTQQQGAHPGQDRHQPEVFHDAPILFVPFSRIIWIAEFYGQDTAAKQDRIDSAQDWNQAIPFVV
jgi:hypothetical protein